jgi:hypothetical protein
MWLYALIAGADPGFQARWGALKKIAPSGGRRENILVFRVKNHDFTPKNYSFSNWGGRRENFWGISCEKSRFYAKKSYFFQFFPWIRPWIVQVVVNPTTIRS